MIPDRIRSKIEFTDTCWLWTAATSHGYGRVQWDGRLHQAHRVVYELLVGSIPEGLTIDHLCRVRNCVNPEHMEPVTNRENILRGEAPSALHAKKTHCPQGHPYSEENTFVANGSRNCKKCNNTRTRRWREKQADACGRTLGPEKKTQTHCINGHEFTSENTYIKPNGTRMCRSCHKERQQRRRLKVQNAR